MCVQSSDQCHQERDRLQAQLRSMEARAVKQQLMIQSFLNLNQQPPLPLNESIFFDLGDKQYTGNNVYFCLYVFAGMQQLLKFFFFPFQTALRFSIMATRRVDFTRLNLKRAQLRSECTVIWKTEAGGQFSKDALMVTNLLTGEKDSIFVYYLYKSHIWSVEPEGWKNFLLNFLWRLSSYCNLPILSLLNEW